MGLARRRLHSAECDRAQRTTHVRPAAEDGCGVAHVWSRDCLLVRMRVQEQVAMLMAQCAAQQCAGSARACAAGRCGLRLLAGAQPQ